MKNSLISFILLINTGVCFSQTLPEIISNYTDCLHRTTLNPSNKSECLNKNYDSNNAILWSGEMAILINETTGKIPDSFKINIINSLNKHFSQPGLLSRHPEPYRFQENMRPISFDEYHGLAFLSSVIPEFRKTMDEVVEYGEKNYWQFWDVPGLEKGKPLTSLLTINNLLVFKNYLNEDSLRKSTLKYPSWSSLFATHHIHQRALYKMFSTKYKPTFFEELYFSIAGAFAGEKDNYSSLNMWIFRFKALDNINYDSKLVSWSKKYFLKKMKERFGHNYEVAIFREFYEDQNHPFHKMVAMPDANREIAFSSKD